MTRDSIEKIIAHNRRSFAAHHIWAEFQKIKRDNAGTPKTKSAEVIVAEAYHRQRAQLNALRELCTTDHETKDAFIARVKAILND